MGEQRHAQFQPPRHDSAAGGDQRMKVSAGMDSGAFGWASGANVNIVTKSGSNEFHGDAWEFFRNSDLNARSHFIPKVGAFHWNQFGVTGGGPLIIPKVLSKQKALVCLRVV